MRFMPEKIVVIHNPLARGGKATKLQPPPAGTGADVSILETTTPEQATALAREAVRNGVRKIVAAGGDGTLNAVANGIEGCEDVFLGILPVGTMNVFAREIGLPLEVRLCWRIILKNHSRRVDLGKANGRVFLSNAGVGLDAQVVAETDMEFRRQIGPLSYVLKGLEIAGRPAPQLKVNAEELGYCSATFVIMGNGRFYGGPFEVFKGGSTDDGLLDVILFKKMSHWDALRYLHSLLLGSAQQIPDAVHFRTARLSVTSATQVPYELDGELAGHTPVEFEVKKLALSVLCPA
jgi:diacylglycerol kinase (ATP)